MENYQITVNNNKTIELKKSESATLDLILQNDGTYHLLDNNKSYHIQVLEQNQDTKSLQLLINGKSYSVQIEDEYDQLVKKLGLEVTSSQKINDIKAPMPGLVLEVAVEPGQSVSKGDTLLILEAMKMENIIKAPGDGTIGEILIEKGTAVEKGAVLIKLD